MARKMTLAGGRRPQFKNKKSGFTLAKQEIFFAELAATCNVSAAARKARLCKATVYVHRRTSAGVRARWAVAVREAYANLELAMLDRGLNGTVKTVTRADGSVDKTHEYPNAVALTLLRRHQELAAEAGTEHDPAHVEELRERLANKIERLRKRLDKETAKGTGGGSDKEAEQDCPGDSHVTVTNGPEGGGSRDRPGDSHVTVTNGPEGGGGGE